MVCHVSQAAICRKLVVKHILPENVMLYNMYHLLSKDYGVEHPKPVCVLSWQQLC